MKTGYRTTYILLERGTEDVSLLKEIRAVWVALDMQSIKWAALKYPLLLELQQGLEAEIRKENGLA